MQEEDESDEDFNIFDQIALEMPEEKTKKHLLKLFKKKIEKVKDTIKSDEVKIEL